MSEVRADVTIVGTGIAGLWSAKELLDRGLTVNLVESSPTLAAGATTRNEGWLHAGTYHAVGIANEEDANKICSQLRAGHAAMIDFAPECIEQSESFALIKNEGLADQAFARWTGYGIGHREIGQRRLQKEGIRLDDVKAAFAVNDKSINTIMVCAKLARYASDRGARIFTGAAFTPLEENKGVMTVGDQRYDLVADSFLITAGHGIKDLIFQLTGQSLSMRYFKSHVLFTRRLLGPNCFYIDPGEAGVMNHGQISTAAVNKNNVEVQQPDNSVVDGNLELIREALCRLSPAAGKIAKSIGASLCVACVKPDTANPSIQEAKDAKQDLDIKVFEPHPGYICALPGKMTQAPVMASISADYLMSNRRLTSANKEDSTSTPKNPTLQLVTPRPFEIS